MPARPSSKGGITENADNRLIFYRDNQRKMPIIAHGVIPERLRSKQDYLNIQQDMYRELRKHDAEILCHEWVDSRGVIVRFSRNCVEIKAIDEQECLHSDMAVTALSLALLRSKEFDLTEDEDDLRSLTEEAIHHGTGGLRQELRQVFDIASRSANADERPYLPLIRRGSRKGAWPNSCGKERGRHPSDPGRHGGKPAHECPLSRMMLRAAIGSHQNIDATSSRGL